jgi:hypothetical protein
MLSQLGRLVADLEADQVPFQLSAIPVGSVRTIPLHRFRRVGLELAAICYRTMDRWGR